MKQFFTGISIFIIPTILVGLFTLLYYKYNRNRVNFELTNIANFECLILGDSQMQRIDPKAFSFDAYNFASSGEHYYFTYQKLKKIISTVDHKIKIIVLGVSVHNFSPVYNRLFDLDFPEGQRSLSRYLYFIDLDEHVFIKDKKKLLSKSLIKGIYLNSDWGGFTKSTYKNPDSLTIMKTLEMHYGIASLEKRHSEEQMKYLHLIDSLCKSNSISLFLVSTPYHPFYMKNIHPYYTNNFKKVLNNMENTNYINYLDYQIDPILMSDGNHLNYKGSEIFSKKINERINTQMHNKDYNQ